MTRINRAIELLEQGQPIYYAGAGEQSFAGGVKAAQTHADYLCYEMEHAPFNVDRLNDYMRGLIEGGPTRSGHRTPAVVVTLPTDGTDETVIRANAWMVKQILATGVHGIILCHAESPAAVRALIESVRYPFHRVGVGAGLGEGRRGSGGQGQAASVWGVSVDEYLERADVWPLNPRGEVFIGLKIEDRRALTNVEETLAVPGIAFAEWGPGDMSMSLGFASYQQSVGSHEMNEARARVFAACRAHNVAFLDGVQPDTVVDFIKEGGRVGLGTPETLEIGRRYTGRTMPW